MPLSNETMVKVGLAGRKLYTQPVHSEGNVLMNKSFHFSSFQEDHKKSRHSPFKCHNLLNAYFSDSCGCWLSLLLISLGKPEIRSPTVFTVVLVAITKPSDDITLLL